MRLKLPVEPRHWLNPKAGLAVVILAVAGFYFFPKPAPRSSTPITHDIYIWQRAWNASLANSIVSAAANVTTIVPLAAEVAWKDGEISVTRVRIDFGPLKDSGRTIGFALRIGPYSGAFRAQGEPIDRLADLAASLISDASTQNVTLSELHLDFDCPDSQLDGYRLWVKAIQTRLSPVPVIITALPSWLNEPAFRRLAATADGYILQVHSLEKPTRHSTSLAICDTQKADRWIERAARLGFPFRVALPTYGYLAAFNPNGDYLGASAEGPSPLWPSTAVIHEIRSDPEQIARLIERWKIDHPTFVTGVVWYRMPVASDRLNWDWPTLAAVMNGRTPNQHWTSSIRWREPGLAELLLNNDGEADLSVWPAIRVIRKSGRLIAGDGLNSYEFDETRFGVAEFLPRASAERTRLRAGESKMIGWIRLETDKPIELQVEDR